MQTPKSPASDRCWWPLLLLVAFSAYGQDDAAPSRDAETAAAPEFLDFLEYLGSWDGEEQDWMRFLEIEEQLPQRDAAGTEQDELEQVELKDVDDVVS